MAKKRKHQFYVRQRAKTGKTPKPYCVLCGHTGDDGEETIIMGEYATLTKAEEHAARLNAANAPPKLDGPFVVLPDSTDEEDHYGVYVRNDGDDERAAAGSHDEDRMKRLADLLNQLVQDFADGVGD